MSDQLILTLSNPCDQVVSSIESGEGNAKQYQSNIDGWAVDIIEVGVLTWQNTEAPKKACTW